MSQHVGCLLIPCCSASQSDFYCLPKTSERAGASALSQRGGRGEEQETLQFIFSFFTKTTLARQSCKKLASPQLGNRDGQKRFARKLSKVCHSERSRNMFLLNLQISSFLAPREFGLSQIDWHAL